MSVVNISTCPICKSKDVKPHSVVNGFRLIKCNNCRVIVTAQNTSTQNDHNKHIYGSSYVRNYLTRGKQLSKRFIKTIKLIEKYKMGGSLLDIGCGLGLFLKTVRLESVGNWKLFGLEPNRYLVKIVRHSIKDTIINGGLPNTRLHSHLYDCVTCLDVIEHNIQLHQNLIEIKRILKSDGLFVLQVPNYQSLMAKIARDQWDWWSPPDHILHFSLDSITSLLNYHGYEILNRITYEDPRDFLGNIRSVFKQYYLGKYLFVLSLPLLVAVEKIADAFGFGGLSLLVCRVKPS